MSVIIKDMRRLEFPHSDTNYFILSRQSDTRTIFTGIATTFVAVCLCGLPGLLAIPCVIAASDYDIYKKIESRLKCYHINSNDLFLQDLQRVKIIQNLANDILQLTCFSSFPKTADIECRIMDLTRQLLISNPPKSSIVQDHIRYDEEIKTVRQRLWDLEKNKIAQIITIITNKIFELKYLECQLQSQTNNLTLSDRASSKPITGLNFIYKYDENNAEASLLILEDLISFLDPIRFALRSNAGIQLSEINTYHLALNEKKYMFAMVFANDWFEKNLRETVGGISNLHQRIEHLKAIIEKQNLKTDITNYIDQQVAGIENNTHVLVQKVTQLVANRKDG